LKPAAQGDNLTIVSDIVEWFRGEKVKMVGLALAAGLLAGGVLTFVMSLSKDTRDRTPVRSIAAAIASDQAPATPAWAKAKAKRKLKQAAAKPSTRVAKEAPTGVTTAADATPTATPEADNKKPRPRTPAPAAAPRRVSTPRVVTKRRATITPQRRATKPPTSKPAPAPAPASPAPAAPAPQPQPTAAPAPTQAPPSPPPGRGNGHGNGNGGDDDPGHG
jgi:hypothetical protein